VKSEVQILSSAIWLWDAVDFISQVRCFLHYQNGRNGQHLDLRAAGPLPPTNLWEPRMAPNEMQQSGCEYTTDMRGRYTTNSNVP